MNTLLQEDLSGVSGGGDPAYVDAGQFVGAFAKSIVEHLYFGPFTATFAFFDALVYAFED
ncbi:MAG: hypothetical protein KBA71_09045 [Opitutaceae bacterium]|nr:hypothetical protein [Opitutaceae bacterium]